MNIEENQKVEVLLNLLDERYNASHEMRRRSTQFTVWLLGFVLVANGWLIINGDRLSSADNILITTLVTILGGITVLFIKGIQKGFRNNFEVLIKLENILGCYEVGVYKENVCIYPEEYKEYDGFNWFGHFETLYMWIVGTYIITVLIIWI